MSKTVELEVTEQYLTESTRMVNIDLSEYPQTHGMSDDELEEWITQNYYSLRVDDNPQKELSGFKISDEILLVKLK